MEKPFVAKNGLTVTANNLTVGNTVYVVQSGNVGFGTPTPSSRIQAYSATDDQAIISETQGATGKFGLFRAIAGTRLSSVIQYKDGSGRFYTSGSDMVVGPDTNNYLSLQTNNTERARIDASGNVGIGTSSPTTKLDVYGGSNPTFIKVGSASTSFASQIIFDQGANANSFIGLTNDGYFDISNSANAAINGIRISTNNVERMRIDGNTGNIGIGTSTPANRLHVAGPSSTIRNQAISGSSWFVGQNIDAYILQNESNTPMIFATNSTEKARISANGNVGIGTSSPSEKLDVNGNINLSGKLNQTVLGRTATITTTDYDAKIGSDDLYFYLKSVSGVNGTVGAIQYLRNTDGASFWDIAIQPVGGNLAVGKYTADAGYKLDVAGNIKSTSIYANKVYNSVNNVRLPTLLTTISVSNGASISTSDVFSTFGADYSDFMIAFYRLVPDVNDKHIYLRWYANGAYQTTNYFTYTATFNGGGSTAQSPTNQYWLCHRVRNVVNRGYTGNINIFNAKNTDSYKQWYHDSAGWEAGADNINRMWGGGDLNISSPITGFQIYAESGNISGVVKIYGLS